MANASGSIGQQVKGILTGHPTATQKNALPYGLLVVGFLATLALADTPVAPLGTAILVGAVIYNGIQIITPSKG